MSQLHDITRGVYHQQHDRLRLDEKARNRIHSMYTEEYFGLGQGWFNGKTAADIGCGNMAVLAIRLLQFGAAHVTLADLGDPWMGAAKAELERDGFDPNRYTMRQENVVNLKMTGQFDFVACNGVLCHLENTEETYRGFAECAALVKPGGWYYTSYGTAGGMIEGAIFPYLRERYRADPELRRIIDTISPDKIRLFLTMIASEMREHTGESFDLGPIADLIGEDFCVFLQNVSQPPKRLMLECSPAFIESLYRKNGFTNVRRLRRYVKRDDIRKFVAPLHFNKESPISRLLYGEGSVEYIAQRG